MRIYKIAGAMMLIAASAAILLFNVDSLRYYSIQSPFVAIIGALCLAFGLLIGSYQEPQLQVSLLDIPAKSVKKE